MRSLHERLVCEMLAEGLNRKQIALRLDVRETTVHKYAAQLWRDTGFESQAELAVKWWRDGWRP